MEPLSMDINRELLKGFIDEAIENLSAVDDLLVKLEASPGNREIINAVFRPIHSLKSNAAYFGLMNVKKLAHAMENLLDMARKRDKPIDRDMIDALLPGVDLLRAILSDVRESGIETVDKESFDTVLRTIGAVIGNATPESRLSEIRELLDYLRMLISDEARETLEGLIKLLVSIPSLSSLSPDPCENKAGGNFSADLPMAAAKFLEILEKNGPILKDRKKTASLTDAISLMRAEFRDGAKTAIVNEIADIVSTFSQSDSGIDDLAISLLKEKLYGLNEPSERKPPGEGPDTVSATTTDAATNAKAVDGAESRHEKTIRIPERSLDDFLLSVGELLGVEELFRHVSRLLAKDKTDVQLSRHFLDAVRQFESISGELRSKVMDIRKVEARILLQKSGRIVRDICATSGKEIETKTNGEDLRIDKSYIDLLDAPLVHMVRNAADHGIEPPKERKNAGKPPKGTISIELGENEDNLILSVTDDGAGLDYDGLLKKAVSLGIVKPDARLSSANIVDLLFISGVSTAKTVTDVSGRGVGMDVVKRAIQEAGGKIEVESAPKTGTKFTILLPRDASTQIIDGYIVRSLNAETYVFPLGCVIEAFHYNAHDISNVPGGVKTILRRDSVFPLYMLDSLLGDAIGSDGNENRDGKGLLIDTKQGKSVISVDEIVGIQKVVCKPIEGDLIADSVFAGAAISATGNVQMIIDPEKLIQGSGKKTLAGHLDYAR